MQAVLNKSIIFRERRDPSGKGEPFAHHFPFLGLTPVPFCTAFNADSRGTAPDLGSVHPIPCRRVV